MTFVARMTEFGERAPLPDMLTRGAIAALVARTDRRLGDGSAAVDLRFAKAMADFPIAINTREANEQHYELPPSFFGYILGARRKYSSCFYADASASLDEAEEEALSRTIANAALRDGQRVLELGCGWGSLAMAMAERFPGSEIVAVSNAHAQRAHIKGRAAALGLRNLTVLTADMNGFAPSGTFDRIVSVEMFEHMSNWRALLERARGWLKPDGRLFIHIFTYRGKPYRFETGDRADWIARHFFTGGIMPSHGLAHRFPDLFAVEEEWRWSGEHYRRTADDWLRNFDRNRDMIDPILAEVYGGDANLWRRRWRLFFLATSSLFGHRGGDRWGVGHYRLRPA
ncbi:MAG: cyclopropane-fatty-acyl-phospholipid synthase family protein [Rhizobiaceae bacterium]